MRFSQKKKMRFVEAQNTKKSWKNFFDKIQNGGVNQDGVNSPIFKKLQICNQ
jgi:hypothetical protein